MQNKKNSPYPKHTKQPLPKTHQTAPTQNTPNRKEWRGVRTRCRSHQLEQKKAKTKTTTKRKTEQRESKRRDRKQRRVKCGRGGRIQMKGFDTHEQGSKSFHKVVVVAFWDTYPCTPTSVSRPVLCAQLAPGQDSKQLPCSYPIPAAPPPLMSLVPGRKRGRCADGRVNSNGTLSPARPHGS
jgi:hypothetical protein